MFILNISLSSLLLPYLVLWNLLLLVTKVWCETMIHLCVYQDENKTRVRSSHRGEKWSDEVKKRLNRVRGRAAWGGGGRWLLEVYFPCSRELCGVSAILRHFLPWPLKITHRKTGRPAAHQCSIQFHCHWLKGWLSHSCKYKPLMSPVQPVPTCAVPTLKLRVCWNYRLAAGVKCSTAGLDLRPTSTFFLLTHTHKHKQPLFTVWKCHCSSASLGNFFDNCG